MHSGCSLKSWPLAWFARGQYLVWQAVAGPRTTSVRTSSLSPLENVGKVSVSGALTWSELQKELRRAGRWRRADRTAWVLWRACWDCVRVSETVCRSL